MFRNRVLAAAVVVVLVVGCGQEAASNTPVSTPEVDETPRASATPPTTVARPSVLEATDDEFLSIGDEVIDARDALDPQSTIVPGTVDPLITEPVTVDTPGLWILRAESPTEIDPRAVGVTMPGDTDEKLLVGDIRVDWQGGEVTVAIDVLEVFAPYVGYRVWIY